MNPNESSDPAGDLCALAVALVGAGAGANHIPRAGHPVTLAITLRNTGPTPVRINHWSDWFECQYDLRGPDGAELPRTRFGNARYHEPAALTSVTALAPGEAHTSEVLVSRAFDMTVAGAYRVAVSREVRAGPDEDWIVVTSQTLSFVLAD
jgi:hypothetical protein